MTASFPFFFYGAAPTEWYGGGRLDYEVRFAATPDAAARAVIATTVGGHTAGLAEIRLDVHDRWHWADAWAALVVRTRTSETDWTVFFDEVAGLFRAVHAACRVDVVVCRSVDTSRADDDPWTAWTLANRPEIGARPRWSTQSRAGNDRFAARDAALPVEGAFDAAFEAARRAAT